MKHIRVMADFSSNGIWNDDENGGMFEYEDLNLSQDLIDEFERWISYYNGCWKDQFDTIIPDKMKICNEMGRILAKKLKQLFPMDQIELWVELETGNYKDGTKIEKEIINA